MNLVLTGFMGTGKSSVARELARRLGLKFVDTDSLVRDAAGLRIPEIFTRHGEAYFRRLEKEAVDKVVSTMDRVALATGGGTVVDDASREKLKSWGTVICLAASLDTILKRVGAGKGRPLAGGMAGAESEKEKRQDEQRHSLEVLLKQRKQAYEDSDLLIDTTAKSVSMIADEVEKFLSQRSL